MLRRVLPESGPHESPIGVKSAGCTRGSAGAPRGAFKTTAGQGRAGEPKRGAQPLDVPPKWS
jgi:hypothetical protein